MAKEDDDQIETVDQLEAEDAKDQAQLDAEGSDDAIGTSTGLDSGSPYSAQLKSLLTQYQGALTKRSTDRTAILAEAQRKLLARAADPMGEAAMYFKMAGAFGKPTRTGSFGETMGNVGEALAPEVEKMQARKDALSDLQMKYKQMGLDQDVNDLGGQIGVITKLSQLTQGKQGEYQTLMRQLQGLDPKSPTYTTDKAMLEKRMNKMTWTPGDKSPTSEVDRLTATIESKTSTQLAKTNAQKRLDRLNYIKPEEKADTNLTLEQWANKVLMDVAKTPGSHPKADVDRANAIIKKATHIAPSKDSTGEANKAVSPLGKVAQDEGLTPGTPAFNKRVQDLQKERSEVKLTADDRKAIDEAKAGISAGKTLVLNLSKALKINEKAYEGFAAGARRTFGRNIPLVGESEGIKASTELENLVGQNALSQLKITFGGNPTEGERGILMDLQGSLNMNASERAILFKNAQAAALRKIKEHEETLKERRSGAMHKAQTEEFAEGGYVKMEDGGHMELDDEQLYQKLTGANVNYGSQGRQESAMLGAGRKMGPGYASVEGQVSHMPDVDPRTFSALSARYSHPVGQGRVSLSATQPTGAPVRLADLQASYPVGRGSVDAGVSASHYLPTRKNQVDARYLNLSHPAGSGTFNFGVTQPTQGPTQYNANYKMNFANGGAVRMENGGAPPTYTPTEEDADYSLANFGRAVGQGAGFSFGDEAIARVRAQMENRPYEDVLAEERGKYAAFANKHPYAALGTELVSGLAPSLAMEMIPGGQAPAAIGLSMTASRGKRLYDLAKTSGSAGAQGFVSGMGASEGDMGDRLSEGVKTGATTAVVAPTLSKVITKTGQGLKAVKKALLPSATDVSDAAINKVLNAMNRDSVGMRSLKRTMARDAALGVKSTLADVTPSLTSLGEAVVAKPGGGRKILGDPMEKRLEAGRQNVGDKVTKAVGNNVNYADQEGKMVSTLRGNANTAYKDAYAFGTVNDPRITQVLEDPTFKKAYDEARSIAEKEKLAAQLRGENTDQYDLKRLYTVDADGTARVTQMPDVRTLDYIKRGIDSIIDKGFGGTNPLSKTEANALKDVKKEFVKVIDSVTTDPATGVSKYAQARTKYAGDSEVLEALRFGKDEFLKKGFMPDQAKAMVKTMSDAEKNALRAGVAQSILNDILTRPQQINAAQIVISAPATKARLAALFDNPNDYKLFEAALEREAQVFRNAQDLVRNSRTAPRAAAMKDLDENSAVDITGQMLDLSASSGPGSFLAKLFKMYQQGLPMSEKVANEVAQILKTGTPREVQKVTERLEGQVQKQSQQAAKSAVREKKMTSAISVSSGKAPKLPTKEEPSAEDQQAADDATFEELKKKYATEEQ